MVSKKGFHGKISILIPSIAIAVQIYVSIGLCAGVHRLWCHQGYKAVSGVRIFLMIAWTLMGGSSINNWSVHHKVHHKCSDTDGDPHNTKRGLFYCHIGWTMRYPHPEYLDKKRSLVNYLNFTKDPVVKFNHDHYMKLVVLCNLIVVMIPVLFMEYKFWDSFLISFVLRSVIAYNWSFLINSAAHLYGNKPYNLDMDPVQNWSVSFGSGGEGYHNYHHSFPFDYAASEDGEWFNISKWFIESCSLFGWTYDLKRVSREVVMKSKRDVLQSEMGRRKTLKEGVDPKVLEKSNIERNDKKLHVFLDDNSNRTRVDNRRRNLVQEILNYAFN